MSYSKNQELSEDDSDYDCTKFAQRFKKDNEEDMAKRVYPPGRTLHVSNLPSDITFELFAENIFLGEESILDHVQATEIFTGQNGNQMLLICFDQIEMAVQALCTYHNQPFEEDGKLVKM